MVITAELPKVRHHYCTLYLVRHGETEWNVIKRVQGHTDSPLTERGVNQAQQLCELLASVHFAVIFSSDLLRAHRTAEILNIERNLALTTSHLLRERHYQGDYEGKPEEEYLRDERALIAQLKRATEEEIRRLNVGGAESDEEIIGRVATILREIAVGYPGKNVLVVTHGGAIRTLLIHLGWTQRKMLPKGSFSHCGYVKLLCDGIDFFVEDVVGVTLTQ